MLFRSRTKALVLIDGSQFGAAMGPALRAAFAQPNGFATLAQGLFRDMFTAKSAPATAQAVMDRALRLP